MDTKSKSRVSHVHVNDSETIDEAQADLNYLIRSDKIYVPKHEEKTDTLKLAILGKPYYISENKILPAYYA